MTTAVGTAIHNGWAVLVAVCVSSSLPSIVDRRRAELVEPDVPSQPYHHEALELGIPEAESLIARVRGSAVASARAGLSSLQEDLGASHTIVGLALPEARAIPSKLADVLASREALYIADRELYVASLGAAAGSLGIPVSRYPRKGEFTFAAQATDLDPDDLQAFVSSQRKVLGPPWTKDHRTAAAAAIGVLATSSRISLPSKRAA